MRLSYVLPSPRHRSMFTIHAAVEAAGAAAVHILPAMLPNLHVRLAGSCSYLFADGLVQAAPPVSLIGPTSAAYRMVMSADLRLAAVGLLPAGWMALVGAPATECADRIVDAADLWGDVAVDRLLCRLSDLPFDGRHTAAVEAFCTERPPASPARDARHVAAIDRWLEGSASLSVDELAGSLGLCRRQVQRATLDVHGMGPKTLAMKYRALRAAATIALSDDMGGAELSAPYTDQSHMIRDFHRFVGWTPGALRRDPLLAARATILGRRRAGGARPLVILT